MGELKSALAHVDRSEIARPAVEWAQPQAVQVANIYSRKTLVVAIALNGLRLRKQQCLRLGLLDVAHPLDPE